MPAGTVGYGRLEETLDKTDPVAGGDNGGHGRRLAVAEWDGGGLRPAGTGALGGRDGGGGRRWTRG